MTNSDPADLGTILGVWAHPDDEAYLSAAIMAAGVDAGNRVVCVTATRGEAGSLDPERWPPAALAAVREAELNASLDVLGVREHTWLDYPDGGCADVPVDEGAARVAEIIDQVHPDTVLTFGPDGMTWHPDHIAVSEWTSAALRRAGSPGARLLYATKTPDWGEMFMTALELDRVMMADEPLPALPLSEIDLWFRADGEALERKYKAMLCQESQVGSLLANVGEETYLRLIADEYFRVP